MGKKQKNESKDNTDIRTVLSLLSWERSSRNRWSCEKPQIGGKIFKKNKKYGKKPDSQSSLLRFKNKLIAFPKKINGNKKRRLCQVRKRGGGR